MSKNIAEVAQGELLEFINENGDVPPLLWKVFKQGSLLQEWQKQWPCGMLENGRTCNLGDNVCWILGGLLLEDGRFAFEMARYWGDLHKLINTRMQQNNNQSPPFTKPVATLIMTEITRGMQTLHKDEILHRDLKASNILVANISHTNDDLLHKISLGVVGLWISNDLLGWWALVVRKITST